MTVSVDFVRRALRQLRVSQDRAADPAVQAAANELHSALARFAELLPAGERPADPAELIEYVAGTNAFDPLRIDRRLPVTAVLHAGVYPGYFEGEAAVGQPAWRLCHTDGGSIGPSPVRDRLLDEATRLAEAMHDKNPFGEVPFDGGKTVFVQEGPHFQAVTALYGEVGNARFVLAKGGIRHYAPAPVSQAEKEAALRRWAASSALAGVLGRRYIGGPDMRMGESEMAWVDGAAAEAGAARGVRQLPAVTGLAAGAGGFPHSAWELTGRTVTVTLKEALLHPAMGHYGVSPTGPVRVLIQGFGDVGGSVARLLTEETPRLAFRIVGVSDEYGAIYRAGGLDVPALLRLRAGRRPVTEYAGEVDALWVVQPTAADRARSGFRGTNGLDLVVQDADVFVPAAIPNVIDAGTVDRLRVRVVAEGANNAVAPRVEDLLHRRGVLYLPGQALNWGGVKGSTLEVLFRELTKRTLPWADVAGPVRAALAPLAGRVDLAWALDVLRCGLSGPPLDPDETRAFAVAVLEDLARSNTRWLMTELVASGHRRHPLDLVRTLSRGVRALKAQLLSLVERGLGDEFFAPGTPVRRLMALLDDRLRELHGEAGDPALTAVQVVEQRQMLGQLQMTIPAGLFPVFAALLAALDLARQKVMDPDGYSQASLSRDLEVLRRPGAKPVEVEASLYTLQRVHPGLDRAAFTRSLAGLVADPDRGPVIRRNAALALAKLGTADADHLAALLAGRADPDVSVRACCRWALNQMAVPEVTQV